MNEVCSDNRFELIEKYKTKLIESTNIETSLDEMNVLDSILFRFWQMGWLDKLEQPTIRWMPCNKAQPKTNGEYLVTLQFKWAKEIDIGEWLDGRWIGLYADDIVAWMDLPDVWEEGSDET